MFNSAAIGPNHKLHVTFTQHENTTGFSILAGGSKCFGTISRKIKVSSEISKNYIRTPLELHLISTKMVLSSSNRTDFDEKQPQARVVTDLRCVA